MNNIYTKTGLLELYRKMVLIRNTEESFIEPILNGTIRCPVHLYTGEEAIAVGIGEYLNNDDIIFGNHRSHGHYLAKGGDLYKMIAEIYCKEEGCAKGRGGSMHVIDAEKGMMGAAPIVGGTISLTLGASLALKLKRRNNIAVSFFGDGATGEGVLYESLNFASLHRLPIIFVCENNYYSTHLPLRETRPGVPIKKIGEAFGISCHKVDGNDLLKVLDVSRLAIDKCRSGAGPVFIEFTTYRMRGHVGPSDNIQGTHTDIRPAAEVDKWRRKDPIRRFEKYLIENNIIQAELDEININVKSEIDECHKRAMNAAWPCPEELELYVFKS